MSAELFERWRGDIDRADFILGQSTREFEAAFGALVGSRHSIGVNSGTDALLLALKAMGIGPGDEVIVPAFTFIATSDVAMRLGAKPVVVDIDPASYCSTAEHFEAAITSQTKALIPVHLYGNGAPMKEIMALAKDRGLKVIEDVAQATGTRIDGKMAGAWGDAGAFSFYPTKNLGAPGDGGLVTTDDDALAAHIRMTRDHGKNSKGVMEVLGYNSRMPTLMASYLLVAMKSLEGQLAQRMENASYYNARFHGLADVKCPRLAEGDTVNNYVLRVEGDGLRDGLLAYLRERGIGCAVYYLRPIHLEPVMEPYGYQEGDFPEAERASREVIALPVWPGLSGEQRARVADTVLAGIEALAGQPA
jgi:dTDP-4-amino-4,6-dideoxygalactose transaminase